LIILTLIAIFEYLYLVENEDAFIDEPPDIDTFKSFVIFGFLVTLFTMKLLIDVSVAVILIVQLRFFKLRADHMKKQKNPFYKPPLCSKERICVVICFVVYFTRVVIRGILFPINDLLLPDDRIALFT
jgi:hypothetical protein